MWNKCVSDSQCVSDFSNYLLYYFVYVFGTCSARKAANTRDNERSNETCCGHICHKYDISGYDAQRIHAISQRSICLNKFKTRATLASGCHKVCLSMWIWVRWLFASILMADGGSMYLLLHAYGMEHGTGVDGMWCEDLLTFDRHMWIWLEQGNFLLIGWNI